MRPMYTQQIFSWVVVIFQLALVGMMQRLTNTTGKMDIRRRHQYFVACLFHSHDALQRVLRPLGMLVAMYQTHDLILVGGEKRPLQSNKTCRIMILYAVTGWTDYVVRISWHITPAPAPPMEYCFAMRADSRFRQLASGFIGIMYLFLENAVMAPDFAETGGYAFPVHDDSPFVIG